MGSLCHLFAGLSVGGTRVVCLGGSLLPFLCVLIAIAVVIFAIIFATRSVNRSAIARWTGAGLVSLAALTGAFAAGQPALQPPEPPSGGRLIALVDVSESLTRSDGFPVALERFRQVIVSFTDAIANEDRDNWHGQVLAFDGTAENVGGTVALNGIGGAITRVLDAQPRTGGSNLASALNMATQIEGSDTLPSVIIALTDGNWINGDTVAATQELQQRGMPVFIVPFGSEAPSSGLVAANLAPEQTAGAPAIIRAVVQGPGQMTAISGSKTAGVAISDDGRAARPVRVETRFDGRGIRPAQLSFMSDQNFEQHRRLMTTVKGPARVLAFGPSAWLSVLPTDRFEVIQRVPGDQIPDGHLDAVVINAVPPNAFPADFAETLSARVNGGTGLFITNGLHAGPVTEPTLMRAWEETALGPMLPVNSDAREVFQDPPPREVIVIVDASGSMDGARLATGKRIAARIINALRPVDRVEVVRFSTSMNISFKMAPATEANKASASSALEAMQASGGTDPALALAYAGKFSGNYCGVFFISDGDFNRVPAPPGCFTTVFEVNSGGILRNPQLGRLGDVQAVAAGGPVSQISFRYLEPEPREETFRTGSFRPLRVGGDDVLTPALDVTGLAISYPRVDAERISVHEVAPADPLMAFRRDLTNPLVKSGVFMSAVPAQWARDPAGQAALTEAIEQVVGWSDPDRYLLEFDVKAGQVELQVTQRADSGPPARISAALSTEAGDILLEPLEWASPGRFVARFELPDTETATSGVLLIEENGTVLQRIPVTLPTAPPQDELAPGAESASFGIDRVRIDLLAGVTGGRALGAGDEIGMAHVARVDPRPVLSYFVLASLAAFALGLTIGGGRI